MEDHQISVERPFFLSVRPHQMILESFLSQAQNFGSENMQGIHLDSMHSVLDNSLVSHHLYVL